MRRLRFETLQGSVLFVIRSCDRLEFRAIFQEDMRLSVGVIKFYSGLWVLFCPRQTRFSKGEAHTHTAVTHLRNSMLSLVKRKSNTEALKIFRTNRDNYCVTFVFRKPPGLRLFGSRGLSPQCGHRSQCSRFAQTALGGHRLETRQSL